MSEGIQFEKILGIDFAVGSAKSMVNYFCNKKGVLVAPAAPALVDAYSDKFFYKTLRQADCAILDSGFLVRVWNFLQKKHLVKLSGLTYMRQLLLHPDFAKPRAVFWILPSKSALEKAKNWLGSQGYPIDNECFYIAPMYSKGAIKDDELIALLQEKKVEHIVVGIGGGTQERLGIALRDQLGYSTCIHCIGAAIGFLTGDQVRIPNFADQMGLGWFVRCLSNPMLYVPRYLKAFKLARIIIKKRSNPL